MAPQDDQDHLSQITTRWSLLLKANRPESADRAAQADAASVSAEALSRQGKITEALSAK